MLKQNLTPLVNRLASIKTDVSDIYFLWAYFDLIRDVCIATKLANTDGGDGKKFVLTIPKDKYNPMSFVLGSIRILGIGHDLTNKSYGISFIFPDLGMTPEGKNWIPWKWSKFKRQEARGKKPYLALNPVELLEYGNARLKWMECVFDIAATQSDNRVIYGRHNSLIYSAAMNVHIRTFLFIEAGIEVPNDWRRKSDLRNLEES